MVNRHEKMLKFGCKIIKKQIKTTGDVLPVSVTLIAIVLCVAHMHGSMDMNMQVMHLCRTRRSTCVSSLSKSPIYVLRRVLSRALLGWVADEPQRSAVSASRNNGHTPCLSWLSSGHLNSSLPHWTSSDFFTR